MTVKELLKMAAKAAGVEDKFIYIEDSDLDNGAWWNPLENDGDAFTLMVKMNMHIAVWKDCVDIGFDGYHLEEELITDGDAFAATRRAITRAAAVIGRLL